MKRLVVLLSWVLALLLGSTRLVVADDDPTIVIISQPVTLAQVHQPYEYEVEAIVVRGQGVITFELRDAPVGMTIDPLTGLIRWLPPLPESFRVKIRASIDDDSPTHGGHADQEYTLFVLNGQPAALRGTVRALNGSLVANVRLRLFEITSSHFVFSTLSDAFGRYLFPSVNPGTYLLRVQPRDNLFADQWYDRAQRIEDATPIVVPESATLTINVTLLARDTLSDRFRLSGTVRDSAGSPLRHAAVVIFRARQHDDRDNSGFNFEGLDDHDRDQRLETVVFTDSAGRYRALLRSGRYVLMAFKSGFERQFGDHKASILEADRLRLISDTSGIDFDLQRAAAATGSIAGTITAAGTPTPVTAHVLGFHRSSPNGRFTGFIRHTTTDSLGRYTLAALRSGFSIVLAIPQGDFLPTFYDTSGGTVPLANAFPVPVGSSAVIGIDIGVQPDTISGMNRVRGTVLYNGQPLAGVPVYAGAQNTQRILGAAVSERYGRYVIVGLHPGTYRLQATKPGFTSTTTSPLALLQQGGLPSTVTQTITLVASPLSVEESNLPTEFSLSQNFPNPFNPSTRISFVVRRAGFVSLKVFDVAGREVGTLMNGAVRAGSYDVEFRAEGRASGTHFYRLTFTPTGGHASSSVRKMLLLR